MNWSGGKKLDHKIFTFKGTTVSIRNVNQKLIHYACLIFCILEYKICIVSGQKKVTCGVDSNILIRTQFMWHTQVTTFYLLICADPDINFMWPTYFHTYQSISCLVVWKTNFTLLQSSKKGLTPSVHRLLWK